MAYLRLTRWNVRRIIVFVRVQRTQRQWGWRESNREANRLDPWPDGCGGILFHFFHRTLDSYPNETILLSVPLKDESIVSLFGEIPSLLFDKLV